MFVEIPPLVSLSDFVRRAKGRSSRKIQQEFEHIRKRYWGQRFWQRGYFSTTSGNITAAAATALVFALSLPLWPQVLQGMDAPQLPVALKRLLGGVGRGGPRVTLFLFMFVATAAQAHHCSFEPGCECLTNDAALAALISGGATFAQLQAIRGMGAIIYDPREVEAARAYWVYAAMSDNVYSSYQDEGRIELPGEWSLYKIYVGKVDVGFYAEVMTRKVDGKDEVVMVFRGTDKGIDDWMSGNLAPISAQEGFAKSLAEEVSRDFPYAEISATGHSLGGALAKAAVEGTSNKAVVFNSSPRGWDGENVIHIEETGDALDYFRDNRPGDIQFDFQEGSKWDAHRMRSLAEGMRRLAGQN